MAESKLRDLSMDFPVKVLKLYDGIKGHFSITNQLERSATSIGANIREAQYAHGTADFVAKFQISLKEANKSGTAHIRAVCQSRQALKNCIIRLQSIQ